MKSITLAVAALGFLSSWPDSSRAASAPRSPAVTRSTARGHLPAAPDSREIVRTLAHPRFEGRGPGTGGLDSARVAIGGWMKQLGLVPAGDGGTYDQWMEVTTGVAVGEPCAIDAAGRSARAGDELQPLGFSTNGTLRAPVVFAGYGIVAPGYGYDDYAGLDVRDKFVLVLTQEPGEMDSTSKFDGTVNTPHAELRTKAIVAREHGALGMIVVNGPQHHAGEPLRKPRTEGAGYMTGGLLAVQVSEAIADSMLARAGLGLAAAQAAIDAHHAPHSLALPDSATVTVTLQRTRTKIANVVGLIPGSDTTRTLVVGAHYDHLGYGGDGSLAPNERLPHVGADDNASGVAGMLRIAGHFATRSARPGPTLVFVAFTGEEMGLVGSSRFVDDPPRPLETVEAMINLDMVGRLRDGRLMVMGTGTAHEFAAILDRADTSAFTRVQRSDDGYGPSDHSSFYKKKVPVLALFTGAHADYHKPTDTWDKVQYDGLGQVADFGAALVDTLVRRPRVTYQQAKSDPAMGRIAGGAGYGAYLGTIPDYMQTEGGVMLSGVRTGSPAEAAGLQADDVIVGFDGVHIDNIYDYTFALRSRKPGQAVSITVRRGGREVILNATLGRRS